jgi:hypothetical protein
MVTSMPTTSRLMQQMPRMRLGWVCFLPASTAVAALLSVGDIGGALLFDKGLQDFGCGACETDSDKSLCQVQLFTPSTNVGNYGSGSLNTRPVLSDFGR